MIAIVAYYQGIEELDAGSPGSTLETPTEPSPESEMSSTIDGESTTAALSPKEAYSFVPIRLYSDDIPFVNVQVYATLSSDYWFAETPKVIEKVVLPSWSETLCTAFMEALQSVNGPN